MQFEMPKEKSSIIKVMGVGGGGGNAVNYMYNQGITGVDFIVCNTDAQDLDKSPVANKIQLGLSLTEGLGAGSDPQVGKNAAIESIDDVKKFLGDNTKMLFVTAGMGGGTGTGASPVIAQAAKEMDILTVGVVSTPFKMEGNRRSSCAVEGLEELKKSVDSILIISNDKLREMYSNLSITAAFAQANNVLTTAVKGISEIITKPGHINVDFRDVRTVMKDSGVAIMGNYVAEGSNRALDAVKGALASPLLKDREIQGAKYILLNITSGTDEEMSMDEFGLITEYLQEEAGQSATLIHGVCTDENMGSKLSVTVIATGFQTSEERAKMEETLPKKQYLVDEVVATAPVAPIAEPATIRHLMIEEEAPIGEASAIEPVAQEEEIVINTIEEENFPAAIEEVVMPEFSLNTIAPTEARQEEDTFVEEMPNVAAEEEVNIESQEQKVYHHIHFNFQEEEEVDEDEMIEEQPMVMEEEQEEEIEEAPFVFKLTEEDREFKEPVQMERPMVTTTTAQSQLDIFAAPASAELAEQNIEPSESDDNLKNQFATSKERLARLRDLSIKLHSAKELTDLENEPAYKRKQGSLPETPQSYESYFSRFTITQNEDGESSSLRQNNSFLHDNVD